MWICLVYLAILGAAAALTFACFGDVGETDANPRDALHFFSSAAGDSNDDATASESVSPEGVDEGTRHICALLRQCNVPPQQQEMISFLARQCCVLPVQSHTVRVLTHPTVFYEELKKKVMAAQHSITLSALYIGDGPLSRAFVACLEERVRWAAAGGHAFAVTILLDYNRMQDRKNLVTLKTLMELAERTGSTTSLPIGSAAARTRAADVGKTNPTSSSASASSSASLPNLADDDLAGDTAEAAMSGVSVRLFLYQNPSRWNRLFSPLGRAKEAMGVQHTKLFVFDGEHTFLTGANLSDDYFATRMDRYVVVEHNAMVGRFFTRLVHTLNAVSHPVVCKKEFTQSFPDDAILINDDRQKRCHTARMSSKKDSAAAGTAAAAASRAAASPAASAPASPWSVRLSSASSFSTASPRHREGSPTLHRKSDLVILPNALGMDPSGDTRAFCARTHDLLHEFACWARRFCRAQQRQLDWSQYDSFLFPTLQVGRAGVYHDSAVVKQLLRLSTAEEHLFLTSPYLNMYASFVEEIIRGASHVDCITASVQTNGWSGHTGVAGRIPLFYLQLERSFHYLMKAYACLSRVRTREFSVEGLTFHAKGLWFAGRDHSLLASPADSAAASHRRGSSGINSSKDEHLGSNATLKSNTDATHAKERTSAEESFQPDKESASNPECISAPYLVAYGSTNYGYRSVHKDVEAEAFLLTTNDALRATLRSELLFLLKQSVPVTEKEFTGDAVGRFQPVISLVAHLGQDFL